MPEILLVSLLLYFTTHSQLFTSPSTHLKNILHRILEPVAPDRSPGNSEDNRNLLKVVKGEVSLLEVLKPLKIWSPSGAVSKDLFQKVAKEILSETLRRSIEIILSLMTNLIPYFYFGQFLILQKFQCLYR